MSTLIDTARLAAKRETVILRQRMITRGGEDAE